MLKNYLNTAIRNLRKQRTHSIINIAGLSVGMTVFILILSYVWFELSFDRFHSKSDRIYALVKTDNTYEGLHHIASTGNLLAEALRDEFPEIRHVTRLGLVVDVDLHYKSNYKVTKTSNQFLRADSSIFNVFDIELVSGDPATALRDPNSIVLTEELAGELYGDENPVGRVITITEANLDREILENPNRDYVVTGVARAMPGNSHFDFQFLLPYGKHWKNSYASGGAYTYLVLPERYSPERLEEKFPLIVEKYCAPEIEREQNKSYEEWVESGGVFQLKLQSLKEIHLDSQYLWDYRIRTWGYRTHVYLFLAIAFFILLLACINFMIMSTARSSTRAKEVGIRRIQGAYRRQLIQQFLAESVILSLLALVISIPLVILLFPTFNGLVYPDISLAFSSAGFIIVILLIITLVVGVLAGSYPAFYLSSFNAITVLRAGIQRKKGGLTLRNGLIIFQFIISIILIVTSLVIYSQLSFMRTKDSGFNKENLVIIKNIRAMYMKLDEMQEEEIEYGAQNWASYVQTLRQEILRNPGVINATNSTSVPGDWGDWTLESWPEGASVDESFIMHWQGTDPAYFDTYGLQFIAGHPYTRFPLPPHSLSPYSPEGVVINEAAVAKFGWKDPLGKTFMYRGQGAKHLLDGKGKIDTLTNWGDWVQMDIRARVIGVVRDHHFHSLRQEIQPMAFYPSGGGPFTVKIGPDDVSGTLELLEETWNSLVPDVPFEYSFLEDDLDNMYWKEERLGRLFLYFTILAILIACLGLFGLAAFTAEQRTKEIGIRKVMGAAVPDILRLLSRTYIILIIIANLVAWPIGYFAIRRWLQDFAYRIDVGIGIFLLTGLMALIIVAIAVSSQAIRASLTDPVKSLRYE